MLSHISLTDTAIPATLTSTNIFSLLSYKKMYLLKQIKVCCLIPATKQLLPTSSGKILLNTICKRSLWSWGATASTLIYPQMSFRASPALPGLSGLLLKLPESFRDKETSHAHEASPGSCFISFIRYIHLQPLLLAFQDPLKSLKVENKSPDRAHRTRRGITSLSSGSLPAERRGRCNSSSGNFSTCFRKLLV